MKLYSALYEEKDPFDKYEVDYAIVPAHLRENDGFLVLWGGEDISPSIYGEMPNSKVYASPTLSKRDKAEIALARKAFEIGMPVVGICRGAQLLCALNGGTLVQHVNNHNNGGHAITTDDGRVIPCNSIHHQMMLPFNTEHKMLAWSTHHRSDTYLGQGDKELDVPEVEPEVVYFPRTNSLAIQGHPEYLYPSHEFVQYCHEVMEKYVLR